MCVRVCTCILSLYSTRKMESNEEIVEFQVSMYYIQLTDCLSIATELGLFFKLVSHVV